MGFLFNNDDDFRDKIKNKFGNTDSYLFAIKNNPTSKGILKLFISNLYNSLDSSRTFLLNFNEKGIYENEISNSDKNNFIFMPWNEIESFEIDKKSKKNFINLIHLGKKISYEIPYEGKMCRDNLKNFEKLSKNNWYKI